jgi:hypothetical protein
MTTQTKTNRQELFLDPTHPNYAELINAGLSERDTCEFYLTNDGKAIAFHFDTLDEYMTYLSKLQGSRVECKFVHGLLGWKYTDAFCLDNRPDGEGWVKFEITTYADILRKEIIHDTAYGKENLLYCTSKLVEFAYNHRYQDVFFRFGFPNGFEMQEAERNQMECDGRYMGIVFNLEDVKR